MKRAGFTMIELIFVIVILGILAAVAVPKLAATREDAKVASEMTSIAQALQNLGGEYVAQGAISSDSLDVAKNAVKCFTLAHANADGNVSVTIIDAANDPKCPTKVKALVLDLAKKNGILSTSGGVKGHEFGGTGVKW